MTARSMIVLLCFAALALPLRGVSRAADGPVDKALAGHYYLSGVHEVGSELLLREDGRFEWMLAYGALDQMAQGTWRRDGDRLLLRADPPPEAPPLFRAQPQIAWSGEAQARFEAMKAQMPAAASDHAIAVILRDPAIDLSLSGVEVVFRYDDGGTARDVTHDGWAFAPRRSAAKIIGVDLRLSGPGEFGAALDFLPIMEGIQPIDVDFRRLSASAFQTMTLRVEGRDLLPIGMAPGRYTRP